LVIARAAGVELAPHRPRQLGEPALDVEVDVLQLAPEREGAALELGPHRVEAREQRGQLHFGEKARAPQRARPRAAPVNVPGPEPPVEVDGGGEGLSAGVHALGEAAAPAGAARLGHARARARSRSISTMIRRVASTRSARPAPWRRGPSRVRGAPNRTLSGWRRGR